MPATGTDISRIATLELMRSVGKLIQSYDYACDTAIDIWHFAVEVDELRNCGLTNSDVRWLLARRFVEYAVETTGEHDTRRTFAPHSHPTFPNRTCLVLTELGAATLRPFFVAARFPKHRSSCAACANSSIIDRSPTGVATTLRLQENGTGESGDIKANGRAPHSDGDANGGSERDVPVWDSDLRELRFRGELIKRYRVPAENQEMILSVFQEEGWPSVITDPLPPLVGNNQKHRLQATIKSLNRNQLARLVRFYGNGNGEAILWNQL